MTKLNRPARAGAIALGVIASTAFAATAVAAPPAGAGPSKTDASITQKPSLDPANVNRPLTYTLTATNKGPDSPKGLTVKDVLPVDVAFQSATASAGGTCTVPAVGTTGTVSCDWANPAAGATMTVAIVVKPTKVGTLTNAVSVAIQGSQDSNTTNDAVSATIRSIPFALAANRKRCTFVGTAGKDTIVGTAGDDVICGLGGNDTLKGVGGNDTLDGGAGADLLYGAAGNDVIYGGAGNDKLYGGAGNDRLFGGLGKDSVNGGLGTDNARILAGDTKVSIEKKI